VNDIVARLEQVRTSCSEQLQTAQSIKGDAFANAAGSVFEVSQVSYLFGEILKHTDLDDGAKDMYRVAAANLLSSITQTLVGTLKRADAEEALALGEQMSARFERDVMGV
jgi:hypothetical protein